MGKDEEMNACGRTVRREKADREEVSIVDKHGEALCGRYGKGTTCPAPCGRMHRAHPKAMLAAGQEPDLSPSLLQLRIQLLVTLRSIARACAM